MALDRDKVNHLLEKIGSAKLNTLKSNSAQLFTYLREHAKENTLYKIYEYGKGRWHDWPSSSESSFGGSFELPGNSEDAKSLAYYLFEKVANASQYETDDFLFELFYQEKYQDNLDSFLETFFGDFKQLIREILAAEKYSIEKPKDGTANVKSMEEKQIHRREPIVFKGKNFTVKSKSCFIAMPFSEKWSARIHKMLAGIIIKEGFEAKRGDEIFGHTIIEDIWQQINEASVIVADTTGKNPNVFYEIGLAHAIGTPVILITQQADDIPFDFRHLRHIQYEDNADGYKVLEEMLPNFLAGK